jgi:hypothetical protein
MTKNGLRTWKFWKNEMESKEKLSKNILSDLTQTLSSQNMFSKIDPTQNLFLSDLDHERSCVSEV